MSIIYRIRARQEGAFAARNGGGRIAARPSAHINAAPLPRARVREPASLEDGEAITAALSLLAEDLLLGLGDPLVDLVLAHLQRARRSEAKKDKWEEARRQGAPREEEHYESAPHRRTRAHTTSAIREREKMAEMPSTARERITGGTGTSAASRRRTTRPQAHLLESEVVAGVGVKGELVGPQREPPDRRVVGQRDADDARALDAKDGNRIFPSPLLRMRAAEKETRRGRTKDEERAGERAGSQRR